MLAKGAHRVTFPVLCHELVIDQYDKCTRTSDITVKRNRKVCYFTARTSTNLLLEYNLKSFSFRHSTFSNFCHCLSLHSSSSYSTYRAFLCTLFVIPHYFIILTIERLFLFHTLYFWNANNKAVIRHATPFVFAGNNAMLFCGSTVIYWTYIPSNNNAFFSEYLPPIVAQLKHGTMTISWFSFKSRDFVIGHF